MTEINEQAIAALGAKGYAEDKCPFCGEDPHDFLSKKGNDTKKVVSKPKQLACSMSGGKLDSRSNTTSSSGPYPYTLAKHHLISAKQCYAKLPPLVRMGSLVGYDVNEPPNGIGLPTTHYTLKYPDISGVKYGALEEDDKKEYAFALMGELKAQWHVGHHSFEYNLPFEKQKSPSSDDWGDEVDDKTTVGHETGYDTQVLRMLIDLMNQLFKAETLFCDNEDKSEVIKEKFNKISEDIRTDLEKFKTNPADSKLFVSRKAYDYAEERRPAEAKRPLRSKKRVK